MKILWNISSHGWGHAARQRELIRVYKLSHPDTHITIASDVPKWFWEGSDIRTVMKGSSSPIVIEKDGDIDLSRTREHFLNFISNRSEYLKSEKIRQLLIKPDLVISDIDPLPIKAAETNSIPAFAIGNFTWDWIMRELFPDLKTEAALVSRMYLHGRYLKLPMSPNDSPFHSTTEVPLLRGGPSGNPEAVKHLLPGGKTCLLALRELPGERTLAIPEGYTAVSCLPVPIHPTCCNITPKQLISVGATFADIVSACDVVISKPGYGIISQILTMGKKAVLLTGRNFPEEKYLLTPLLEERGIKLVPINSKTSLDTAVSTLAELSMPVSIQSYGAETITSLISTIC